MKKVLTLIGIVLILSAGYGFSYQGNDIQNGKKLLEKKNQQISNRFRFIDENGDGISDRFRDFDGDGIPNCQDPEWNRPANSQGNQNGQGGKVNMQRNSNQRSGQGTNNWNKNQFRNNTNCPFGNKTGQKNGNRTSRRYGKK